VDVTRRYCGLDRPAFRTASAISHSTGTSDRSYASCLAVVLTDPIGCDIVWGWPPRAAVILALPTNDARRGPMEEIVLGVACAGEAKQACSRWRSQCFAPRRAGVSPVSSAQATRKARTACPLAQLGAHAGWEVMPGGVAEPRSGWVLLVTHPA
jgi:hypothetical protein